MIGPVGVDDLDLGYGRAAAFGAEVALAELDVRKVHGKAVGPDELRQAVLCKIVEGCEHRYFVRYIVCHCKGLGDLQGCLAGLHRVNDVFLYLCKLCLGNISVECVDLCRADQRPFLLGDQLDALSGGICALVELSGQELHGKYLGAVKLRF